MPHFETPRFEMISDPQVRSVKTDLARELPFGFHI